MRRRQFLRHTAGAAASGAVSLFAGQAGSKNNRILLGFSLYGMRTLDTSTALRTCARIGYQGVELTLNPGWPTEPKLLPPDERRALRNLLEELDLALPALMEHLSLVVDESEHRKNLDRLKAAAELGHTLSPDGPPVIETTLGGRPEQWEKVKHQMADRLGSWAAAGEKTNTTIAIKPHVGGAVHTPEGARWLLEQVSSPWVKFVYDYSHYELRGYGLQDTVEALIGDSVFIHVKDSAGGPDDVKFLLPGDGSVDYAEYFRLIRGAGYRGAVVVEVSGQIHRRPGYDAVSTAEHCYQNLAPALAEVREDEPE